MTDNVNVPREVLQGLVKYARFDEGCLLCQAHEELLTEARALLASAPKTEPKVIGIIGRVSHGKSELSGIVPAPTALAAAPKAEPVVGSLAEMVAKLVNETAPDQGQAPSQAFALALSLQAILASHPEVPKVEQEPVAYRLWLASDNPKAGGRYEFVSKFDGDRFKNSGGGKSLEPLYTHPAPTSDELLEAIDMDDFSIVGEWIESGERGSAPSGRVKGLWQSMRRVIAIAKHKGPQS